MGGFDGIRQLGLGEASLTPGRHMVLDAWSPSWLRCSRRFELFSARVDELLGRAGSAPELAPLAETSKGRELVALGASVGSNSHPLLQLHIAATLDVGFAPAQIEAALKMAEYAQERAGEITAEKATHALEERGSASAKTTARS